MPEIRQRPRICLTLPGPDCAANARHIRECAGTFSALEFRLDRMPGDLQALVRQMSDLARDRPLMQILSPRPPHSDQDFSIILTLRRKEDGGEFGASRAEGEVILMDLLSRLCATPVWSELHRLIAVDVERQSPMDRLFAFMQEQDIPRINSLHYFNTCPENIPALLELPSPGPAGLRQIPKLAVMTASLAELNRVVEAGQALAGGSPGRPFILLAMGTHGRPSRILPEKTGSWISFAAPHEGIAPGQLSSVEIMAYRQSLPAGVGGETALFAIIGNPVSHSISPEYHNKAFAEKGLQAMYIPLHCEGTAAIPAFARLMNLRGGSVTIPHKEAIRSILHSESEACTQTGACNTIYLDRDGNWRGENTDVEGFLRPIRGMLQQYAGAGGGFRRAVVIGAGGAAKSLVYGLLKEGMEVLVLNRSLARAEGIAADMGLQFPGKISAAPLTAESLPRIREYRQLMVQTTSQGMEGREDADPLPFYEFDGSEYLYDIIYTPPLTKIMKRAMAAGCACRNGRDMFLAQAELQADIFARCIRHQ